MDSKTLENQVIALEKLATDTKAQQELGKRLIQQVAEAVYEEKRGVEISNPDLEMALRKGDAVPMQLRDQVETDADGNAVRDTLVQYLNLRIWLRIWIRFWLRIIIDTTFATTPLNRFQEFGDRIGFSGEEVDMMNRLKKISA